MDPVGPWSYAYNSLAKASASFQAAGETGSGDYSHQLTGQVGSAGSVVPSTTSQLLLQAHSTSLTSSPFSPGFLSPPPVGYESVFSPLFHHTNPKTAHFNQHRTLASTVTSGKQPSEADLSSLRESYSSTHHQGLTPNPSYFDHQTSATPQLSSSLWAQGNTQLPSPFGILPHESVVPTSPGSVASKSTAPDYAFHPFAVSQQGLASHSAVDYKNTAAYLSEGKKVASSQPSLTPTNKIPTTSAVSPSTGSFFQTGSSTFPTSPSSIAGFNSNKSQHLLSPQYPAGSKSYGSTNSTTNIQQQQSCIVSSGSAASTKDYNIPQSPRSSSTSVYSSSEKHTSRSSNFVPPSNKTSPVGQQVVQTKAQAKVYPDLTRGEQQSRRSENCHESSQSSPISFALIDSGGGHRYSTASPPKVAATSHERSLPSARSNNSPLPFHHILSPQTTPAAFRHYPDPVPVPEPHPDTDSDPGYRHPKTSATDTNVENGQDCARRSPHAYPMYNSPLATISSPSSLHSEANSGALQAPGPVSPLDVSLSRSTSQTDNVTTAYPSVIRSLSTPQESVNKAPLFQSDARSLERSQDQCWDSTGLDTERHNHSRSASAKYPSADTGTGYNATNMDVSLVNPNPNPPTDHGQQRPADRQQPYFDTNSGNQGALQDLSSCRGDPMTIVKNLQHQTCLPQSEPKTSSNKRRKSCEKSSPHSSNATAAATGSDLPDYTAPRVPPPAHHNANQQQQQQNGTYLDVDRWTRSSFAGAQTALPHPHPPPHPGTFAGAQHQSPLMVHANSSMPYYPPLHLPGHDYPAPTSASAPAPAPAPALDVSQSQYPGNQCPTAPTPMATPMATRASERVTEAEENPKVIVPDIEDELKFLSEDAPPISTMEKTDKKPFASANPATDFMASYLKFLQGEPETLSPPSTKNNRKQAWPRTKLYQPASNPSNGDSASNATTTKKDKSASPAYDPQDDPRYFPLPKTRDKRKSLESDSDSDSGVDRHTHGDTQTADEDKAARKSGASKGLPLGAAKEKGRRGRPRIHPPKVKKTDEDPLLLPPRRETSRRKAKEKISIQKLLDNQENLDDFDIEEPERNDSDSDPAWTPIAATKSSDDESGRRRSGRRATKLPANRRRSKVSGGLSADDASSADEATRPPRHHQRNNSSGKGRRPRSRKPGSVGNSLSGDNDGDGSADDFSDMFPFKSGEFVVIKTDLAEEWPPIWRVDGKTLLQKYEPFEYEGEMLYRNISTYSGWSSDNKHCYRPVAVRFRLQNKSETLVEFLKDEMVEEDEEALEKLMKDTEIYQENFEVYIQTLISQVLDSNFLTEIFQEQDEYFLSNVKKVDDITDERRQKFLSLAKWQPKLEASVATWPCYNVMAELSADEVRRNCAACDKPKVSARVLLYGQPYNSTTLEGSQPDPKVTGDKDFLMCRLCAGRVELYNKVVHQKYLMFIECAKRVSEKRAADPSKDTTAILNDMLADETWLNELFRKARTSWAEIDRMERFAQTKTNKAENKD